MSLAFATNLDQSFPALPPIIHKSSGIVITLDFERVKHQPCPHVVHCQTGPVPRSARTKVVMKEAYGCSGDQPMDLSALPRTSNHTGRKSSRWVDELASSHRRRTSRQDALPSDGASSIDLGSQRTHSDPISPGWPDHGSTNIEATPDFAISKELADYAYERLNPRSTPLGQPSSTGTDQESRDDSSSNDKGRKADTSTIDDIAAPTTSRRMSHPLFRYVAPGEFDIWGNAGNSNLKEPKEE